MFVREITVHQRPKNNDKKQKNNLGHNTALTMDISHTDKLSSKGLIIKKCDPRGKYQQLGLSNSVKQMTIMTDSNP